LKHTGCIESKETDRGQTIYLFRDFAGHGFDGGLWGLLRVAP